LIFIIVDVIYCFRRVYDVIVCTLLENLGGFGIDRELGTVAVHVVEFEENASVVVDDPVGSLQVLPAVIHLARGSHLSIEILLREKVLWRVLLLLSWLDEVAHITRQTLQNGGDPL